MKLLAVDDEPIFRDILNAHLGELGYRNVTFANSGPKALTRIVEPGSKFDCFLVDIRMVPMDGIELVKAIRDMPQHQATPIIVISALSDKASIDAAFIAGANDYITKPIDSVDLKVRLRMAQSILEERAQAQMLQERIVGFETSNYAVTRFESDFALEDVESAIPLAALENYLLKQGERRLRQNCAIGFHMPQADVFYRMMEPVYYADLVGDIAVVISKVISSTPHLLTHLGSGSLVAVLLDRTSVDLNRVRTEIECELEALRSQYGAVGMTAPELNIGTSVRLRRFPSECPTALIPKALAAVHAVSHNATRFNALEVA